MHGGYFRGDLALLVAPTTMMDQVAGGAHAFTERSVIDEPRLRSFGGAANRRTQRSMRS
jgi:hypothetical protein